MLFNLSLSPVEPISVWFVTISSVLNTSLFQGHANGYLIRIFCNMKDLVLIEVSPKLSKEQRLVHSRSQSFDPFGQRRGSRAFGRLVVQNNAPNVMRNNNY